MAPRMPQLRYKLPNTLLVWTMLEGNSRVALPVRLYDGGTREVAPENLAHRSVLDKGELYAKADHDAQDQGHDEELKSSQAPHGPRRIVEQQYY